MRMTRDGKVYEGWMSCLWGVGGNQESYLEEEALEPRRGNLNQKLDKSIPGQRRRVQAGRGESGGTWGRSEACGNEPRLVLS